MHALFVVKVCVPSCSLRFFIQSTCPQLKTLNSFIPFNFIASATPADSKNLRLDFHTDTSAPSYVSAQILPPGDQINFEPLKRTGEVGCRWCSWIMLFDGTQRVIFPCELLGSVGASFSHNIIVPTK